MAGCTRATFSYRHLVTRVTESTIPTVSEEGGRDMLELFDCETLIAQDQKRPGFYDFQLKEYTDKNIKEKLWTEECEAAVTH
ncbi:hypothetical protein E2C01_002601 [Portunus trituberculatus]|uniref:Uncharacterized protein n=1 Tax=Portunus trituberculatus TaxID=210409 RepID=A0A5B7CKC9_PORTR|nr:hypothetical protein [Portunus trituberculatus]